MPYPNSIISSVRSSFFGSTPLILRTWMILTLVTLLSCQEAPSVKKNEVVSLLPIPAEMSFQNGHFLLNNKTRLLYKDVKSDQDQLILGKAFDFLRDQTGYHLESGAYKRNLSENSIVLQQDNDIKGKEGYELRITISSITLKFSSLRGALWGIQSLRQLLPNSLEAQGAIQPKYVEIQNVLIQDAPNFSWRGVLLDLGGRYMELNEVKEFMDIMAYFKLNLLHLRLSHNKAWRIDIPAYPDLVASHSYYTKEELREMVNYAIYKGIEIIPEVSFPNQALCAGNAYPQLSCLINGKPYTNGVYCPSSKATMKFAKSVVSQLTEIFPGKYIHFGGDRVKNDHWSRCERCSIAMKKSTYVRNSQLQVAFLKRLNEHVISFGKEMIAWDENKEYGLDGNIVYQFWRDFREEQTLEDMVHSGTSVIASPMNYTFFHLDSEVLSLYRAYRFNPYPPKISEEDKKLIKGAECVLYAGNFKSNEDFYTHAFPKLLAFSERLWSPLKRGQYRDFYTRMEVQNEILRMRGVKVGPEGKAVVIKAQHDHELKELKISAYTWFEGANLHYSIDEFEPTTSSPLWKGITKFEKDISLKFRAFVDDKGIGAVKQRRFHRHEAIWAVPSLLTEPSQVYGGRGARTLNDGVRGTDRYWTESWLGFSGKDLVYELDWDEEQKLSEVIIGSIALPERWIYLPAKVLVEKVDGNNYESIVSLENSDFKLDPGGVTYTASSSFDPVYCKKVRVSLVNYGPLPSSHKFAGEKSWTFCDEIVLR